MMAGGMATRTQRWSEQGKSRIIVATRYEKMTETPDYIKAHRFSSNHKARLSGDEKCGCFCCVSIFHPQLIKEWIEDKSGTAICPYCGIDAIIGESSGFPITKAFLEKMESYWF